MNISSLLEKIPVIESTIADSQSVIEELRIDSRKIETPHLALFFALKTTKDDGHRYIPELIHRGVRHFIISTPISALHFDKETQTLAQHCNFLQVQDVVQALQTLATAHRASFSCPVIGITGSNGKTIVKEWLSMALSVNQTVTSSPDSYNSQIGVPLSVCRMTPNTNIAVFEAGISMPDEMENLAHIIKPTIGILTNVGMAHAQFFSNDVEKIKEKLKLFQEADLLIYHDNNTTLNNILSQSEYQHLHKISWGSAQADYPITKRYTEGNKTYILLREETFAIPFIDAASVENALHVIVTLLTLKQTSEEINQHLANFSRISMRTEIVEGANHSLLINDTYSLDINALRAALDFMDTQTQLTNKTLILSDFEQVGTLTQQEYQQLNTMLLEHHIANLITVGKDLQQHSMYFTIPVVRCFLNTQELLQSLPSIDFSYQSILIKGARSFHFEKVVQKLQHKTHLTILHVSLPALIHNLRYHRSLLHASTKMVAMVKARSYGLGDAELINDLVQQNIDYLAVAYTDEGVRLRKRHITTPIIVLGAEAHSFNAMVQHNLEPEIFNFYYLHELEEELKKHPHITKFNIHVKVDTGMHRLGFDENDLPQLISILKNNPKIHIASIFSHLAAAEDPAEDAFTLQQIQLFKRMTDQLCAAFDYPILRHILNSAGIVRFTDYQFDMVRLGISLYGFSEIPEIQAHLQNVATLKTVITQVKKIAAGDTIGYNRSYRLERDTQVAIIPIGYADGYPRELSNGRGTVIIQGKKVPVIGKICMDMCMLDVTGLVVHEGDEVIVYGEGNTVAEMAQRAGLISYELLTRLSQRVPRIYVRE